MARNGHQITTCWKSQKWIAIVLILAVLGGVGLLVITTPDESDLADAEGLCQEFVKAYGKMPAPTQFVPLTRQRLSNDQVIIRGKVTASDKSGTSRQMPYLCTVQAAGIWRGEPQYNVKRFELNNKEISLHIYSPPSPVKPYPAPRQQH